MIYEGRIRDAIELAKKTGCTGLALEKHVAKELGCESMTHAELMLAKPDFERLVWPITRKAEKPDDQPKLF